MVDFEKLKKRRAGSRTGSGWKPREGPNKIRILPPRSRFIDNWDAMEDLAVNYKMHFFRIEGRPTEVSRCLEEVKQKCPACEAWRLHRKSEDPGLKEMASQVSPADQYLFNILDIGNLQAGIQSWAANYTCWDKIMEIAANPAWGNVVDPANGVDFEVNLTPGARSRTGFNQYSVTPSPTRTTVMQIVQAIPDWLTVIDSLENQISAAKEPDEIRALLTEMGFPPLPSGGGGVRPPTAPAVGGPVGVPAPVAVSAPMAAPAAPAAPMPLAAPAPVAVAAPAPPLAAPAPLAAPTPLAAPAPLPAAAPVAAAPVAAAGAVHYDPGPGYTPPLSAQERPVGVPTCYSDYNPKLHKCQPCPVIADCQLRMLDVQ